MHKIRAYVNAYSAYADYYLVKYVGNMDIWFYSVNKSLSFWTHVFSCNMSRTTA